MPPSHNLPLVYFLGSGMGLCHDRVGFTVSALTKKAVLRAKIQHYFELLCLELI